MLTKHGEPSQKRKKFRRGATTRSGAAQERRNQRRLEVAFNTFNRTCRCPAWEEHHGKCSDAHTSLQTTTESDEFSGDGRQPSGRMSGSKDDTQTSCPTSISTTPVTIANDDAILSQMQQIQNNMVTKENIESVVQSAISKFVASLNSKVEQTEAAISELKETESERHPLDQEPPRLAQCLPALQRQSRQQQEEAYANILHEPRCHAPPTGNHLILGIPHKLIQFSQDGHSPTLWCAADAHFTCYIFSWWKGCNI